MKKFFLICMGIILVLTACVKKENATKSFSSKIMLLQENKISSISVQFKDNVVTIIDGEKIKNIKQIFSKAEFTRNESLDDVKGWIYKITLYDAEGKNLGESSILDETTIRCEGKVYDNGKIDISAIDEITGIDREIVTVQP